MDVPSGETRTRPVPAARTRRHPEPLTGHEILANTVRALELLADSHTAWEARDPDRCDALVRQAHQECGPDTVAAIQGGMRIGEIPTPDSGHWHDYVQHQRDRLAAMTDPAATGCTAEVSDHTCTCLTDPPTAAPHAKH